MKKTIAAFLLLSACQKEKQVSSTVAPPDVPAAHTYQVQFAVEQERDSGYHYIYVARDRNNFVVVDSIPFRSADSSVYKVALKLNAGSQVKVLSRTADTTIVSSVMEAL